MADPLLDEDYIRGLLSLPAGVDSTDALQCGAVQALVDCYDRKVTREEFCHMAAACLSLYGQCAKLWMLHNVGDVFKEGNLTEEKLIGADNAFKDVIRKQAEIVTEIVKRLQLCPTSQDRVH